MLLLFLAALLWVVIHIGIAGTAVRASLVGRLGEGGFRIGYSVLSFAAIGLLVNAWQGADTAPLWFAPSWLRWLLALLMLPAFVLFVASLWGRNPTAVGGGELPAEPHGIQRVTRHPMLWSFALWAIIHMLGNGDSAALVFFGAFAVTALAGMPSIDAKLAARHPQSWKPFARRTSILPFGAIASGRTRLAMAEIHWGVFVVGFVAWAAFLHLHARFFGVAAVF
jgi:uncharacterized membrane protein